MFIYDRKKYKKYADMRKEYRKHIPHHPLYCYGITEEEGYHTCAFLVDGKLPSHLDKLRRNEGNEYLFSKCALTGKWIFDYCKSCGVNLEFALGEVW